MTKCLLKALKAVDLHDYVTLFRSLGYDSAGALAHFQNEHFKQLNLSKAELLRLHALLDVLKEATREGKICPHYSKTHRQSMAKSVSSRSKSAGSIQQEHAQVNKVNHLCPKKQSSDNTKGKQSSNANKIAERSSSISLTNKSHGDGFILQQQNSNGKNMFGPKSLLNRPPVEHVKIQSYNYGVPSEKRQRNTSHRVQYQNEANSNHASIFVPSSRNTSDLVSYAKPAEIYVYARKRPLLSSESNFNDSISTPDSKRIIIAENKANLDFTPLLKKSEFQFDQVFGADTSNKQVFECTVLPFLTIAHRHNLTYICFGQTGSGKSHTIFGNRNTDGLLIYCAQHLLQEINLKNALVCTFYEIYNNQLYDLSNNGKRLFAREDGAHSVNIVGKTEIVLRNLDMLRSIIHDGLARRHHGKSAFNSNSSRSHAVFQITLKNNYNEADSFQIVFIDLAGSERATDAQNNQRQTRREGAQINSSLLALKECIRSMDMTQTHAPFRQSKLTHILRDSLVGSKTRTCLMANVSPADDCCQCSLNTLQYASRIRDISSRHRHRSMQTANVQKAYFHEDQQQPSEKAVVREESRRNFEPTTASTPVHRLLTSVDHKTYMAVNNTDYNARKATTTSKSANIDRPTTDNDVPISSKADNQRTKSSLSTTREFFVNSNNNEKNNGSSFYVIRYEQKQKKNQKQNDSPSSYFPLPQSDVRKSVQTPISNMNNSQSRPSATTPSTVPERHLSDSSTEQLNSARPIPISSVPMSDDNQYSSTTGTESLGTKITRLATSTRVHKRSLERDNLIENLNFDKQSDTGTVTTITTDTEQGLYSDRQSTHRDQTGYFSHRDELSHPNDFKSNHSSTLLQRTSPTLTPNSIDRHSKSDVISTSSKKSRSASYKAHRRNRQKKSSASRSSSSSSTTATETNHGRKRYSSSKRHHRIVPYQIHHSSDSESNVQHSRKTCSTRNEACQTINNIQIMKNEQEQTDDQFLMEQFVDRTPNNLVHTPRQPTNRLFDDKPSASPTHLVSSSDFGLRVSEQLNTLRTLLEQKLIEQDVMDHQVINDPSVLQTSPRTFTKEFLQSYQRSAYKPNPSELISDLDDDEDNKNCVDQHQLTKTNYDYYNSGKDTTERHTFSASPRQFELSSDYHRPCDSLLSDDVNESKQHLSVTVTPNYKTKNGGYEPQTLSYASNGFGANQLTKSIYHTSVDKNNASGNINSLPKDNIKYTSATSSVRHASGFTAQQDTFDSTNAFYDANDQRLDSGQTNSLLTGTSFDILMNSLRNMREKDLDIIVQNSDDSLIRVTD